MTYPKVYCTCGKEITDYIHEITIKDKNEKPVTIKPTPETIQGEGLDKCLDCRNVVVNKLIEDMKKKCPILFEGLNFGNENNAEEDGNG